MTTAEYLERFAEFLGRNGRRPTGSPWSLVEAWEDLARSARDGYRSGYYEFTNDVGVRSLLDKLFSDPVLGGHEVTTLVRKRVEAADDTMRQAFLPGAQIHAPTRPWWDRGVLLRAGEEYAEDVARLYGIDVETVT